MTHAVHPESTTRMSDTARHWITALLSVVGVVVAAFGTWMAYGDDATLSIFNWTWSVADVSELWAPWLMIGGGLLASISMGWETFRSRTGAEPWVLALEGLVLIAGLTAVVVGVVLLF